MAGIADIPATVLAQSAPVASEATLLTAQTGAQTLVTAIRCAGDATGGAITVHYRKKPAGSAAPAAAAGNALCSAVVVGNATNVPATALIDVCPPGGFIMNGGDILSALGASGGHVTVTVCGKVRTDA